jgi:hypothetical protein
MNWKRILVALGGAVLLVWSWKAYGWPGVLLVSGGLVMWFLLSVQRTITVMQRTANRPVGYVGSAVMLNAKLRPKVTLLHVTALCGALGERLTAEDEQPEVYRWTDPGDSSVTATFLNGRLQSWELFRPEPPAGEAETPPAEPAPVPVAAQPADGQRTQA